MRYVESHQLGEAAIALRPVIRANRQQIDDRFPVLGFTVNTAGLPFYEVVLATDARYFDPRASTERKASNFFSSRESGGELIPADHEIYTAPAEVLQRFAGARTIVYTLIAYADAKGNGAVAALDPSALAANAPTVTLAPGFKGAATASIFGVALENLRRVTHGESAGAVTRELSAEDDRAEGEDGASVNAQSYAAFDDGSESGYDDGYGSAPLEEASTPDTSGYDDGYGSAQAADEYDSGDQYAEASAFDDMSADPGGDTSDAMDYAYDSAFPPDASPPSMLEDEDYADATPEPVAGAHAFDYSDGYDDDAATFESAALDAPVPVADAEFTVAEKRRIIDAVARLHPGRSYDFVNPDGEFTGRFKDPHGRLHPATGRYHLGLSFGFVGFSQDSGHLGRLLAMMRQRDANAFGDCFGPQADALVETTNRAGPGSREAPGGRSARVQPVGGEDLWSPAWQQRFRRAAQHPPFIAAQNELAYALYMEPLLPFARWLGIDNDRGLAMLYDRAINMGVGPTRQWVVNALREQLPLTAAQRQQALSALGHGDLAAFQKSVPGLTANGEFDTQTFAAMVGALRALGARSPMPIPTPVQALDAMVRLAKFEQRRWAPALERLRTDSAFNDIRLRTA